MKKITCLLALFLCVIGTAMAQTQITDISQLSNDKKYTVWTGSRGGWAVKADGTQFVSSNDIGLGTDLSSNMAKPQCQFKFLSKNGGIYLFSVSANKYVNKDCSLSATATDALTFNKQDDGTFIVKFDDTHYINLGGDKQMVVNSYNTPDVGNKVTITELPDALVEVTWKYQIGDQTYKTVTQTLAANTACTAPAVDFFVADSQSANNTGSGETLTIYVSGHENLPFQKTTDLNDPKWYAVSLHTNQKFFLWHYAGNDALVETPVPTLGASDYTVPSDDAYFWCFTGSLIDGFKIYNKKAGTSYTLNSTDGQAQVGTAANNNDLWDLVKSTSSIANSVCFAAHGTRNYINHNGGLKYYDNTDEGSSALFYTPVSFAVNYLEGYMNAPANAVGSSTYFNEQTKADALTKIAAAQADAFNFSEAQTLAGVANNVANGSFVEMAPGYYRIYSALPGLYANNRGLIYDSNNMRWNEVTKRNVNNIVKMEAAAEGKYYLYACNAKKYMQGVAGALGETTGEHSGITVTALGNAQYNLVFGNGTMHANNHGGGSGTGSDLVSWGGGANSASAWYIFPATDLEVALNTVDENSYASAYLPFPVQGEGIYTGTIDGNGSSLDMTAQTGVVPAETGIVIKSRNTTATLTIGGTDNAADVSDNSLKGTLTALTGDLTNYLVLGMGRTTNRLGFYTPGEGITTIAANKAYLLADQVDGASPAIAMNFGGEATGVGTVITENGIQSNAPVFDLSGRRVMQTVKGGLYIQNGKKFIVK